MLEMKQSINGGKISMESITTMLNEYKVEFWGLKTYLEKKKKLDRNKGRSNYDNIQVLWQVTFDKQTKLMWLWERRYRLKA